MAIVKPYVVTAYDDGKEIASFEHKLTLPDVPEELAEATYGPWTVAELIEKAIREEIIKRQGRARRVLEKGGSISEAKAKADGETVVRFPDPGLSDEQKKAIRSAEANKGKTVIFEPLK